MTATLTEHQKLVKEMLAVPFSVIPGTDTDPLWPGWFLKRHVTILVAPGMTGKGLLTIDMAARVSTGRPFPGEPEGTVHEPANVIVVAPEDDPNETLAWRLEAAGADKSRVFNFTVLPDGSPFTVPESVPSLREAMRQIERPDGPAAHPGPVALVIIDPLFRVATKPISTPGGAMRVTVPLENLAAKTGACVVLTHHTVKNGKTAGSKALTDSVRCVLRIEREKSDDPETTGRVLSVEKTNGGSAAGTLRYVVSGDGKGTCIVFPSEVEHLAAALTSSRGYLIDPDMAPPPPLHAVPGPGSQGTGLVELFQSDGGTTAHSLGRFAGAGQAREFAAQKSLFKLRWREGPVDGSYGAASKAADGKFTFYSVLPVEAAA